MVSSFEISGAETLTDETIAIVYPAVVGEDVTLKVFLPHFYPIEQNGYPIRKTGQMLIASDLRIYWSR